jgi:hypothetical protein
LKKSFLLQLLQTQIHKVLRLRVRPFQLFEHGSGFLAAGKRPGLDEPQSIAVAFFQNIWIADAHVRFEAKELTWGAIVERISAMNIRARSEASLRGLDLFARVQHRQLSITRYKKTLQVGARQFVGFGHVEIEKIDFSCAV